MAEFKNVSGRSSRRTMKSTSKLTYSPRVGSIEWHQYQIKELMHPYSEKQKVKQRSYFLGIPSLRKKRMTVRERPSKFVKTQVKFHREQIRSLRQIEREKKMGGN